MSGGEDPFEAWKMARQCPLREGFPFKEFPGEIPAIASSSVEEHHGVGVGGRRRDDMRFWKRGLVLLHFCED